jgi:hypothetical protein
LNLRATLSLLPLILLTFIFTVAGVVLATHDLIMPRELATFGTVFQQLLLAIWVYLDRQRRHLSLPFEFGAFVFFAWPIAVPYYLIKSRGTRGLLLTALFFVLLALPPVVATLFRFVPLH